MCGKCGDGGFFRNSQIWPFQQRFSAQTQPQDLIDGVVDSTAPREHVELLALSGDGRSGEIWADYTARKDILENSPCPTNPFRPARGPQCDSRCSEGSDRRPLHCRVCLSPNFSICSRQKIHSAWHPPCQVTLCWSIPGPNFDVLRMQDIVSCIAKTIPQIKKVGRRAQSAHVGRAFCVISLKPMSPAPLVFFSMGVSPYVPLVSKVVA